MRKILLVCGATFAAFVGSASSAQSAVGPESKAADVVWDQAEVGRLIDSARQAHRRGDLVAADRLCYAAFESVDRSALASYDAYADRLRAEHRSEEATVRAQSARLHELKAEQRRGTQPTSTYLGFAPSEGLNAYADLLAAVREPDASQRMRSLALAYQQVQQAHFQRTMMFRQGQDPRGSC